MECLIKSATGKLMVYAAILATGCAGSAPDYSNRTAAGAGQESKLTALISQATGPETSMARESIIVPFCSNSIKKSPSGWAIDSGNWCVVRCVPVVPANGGTRWIIGADEKRCLATGDSATTLTEVSFSWSDLDLDQQPLFSGFGRSFLSNTEWYCQSFTYEIDPDNRHGFWSLDSDGDTIYRLHGDGRLLTGQSPENLRLAGSWNVADGNRIFFNSRQVFEHAIEYGGGRFDDFRRPRHKSVCRFAREVDSV